MQITTKRLPDFQAPVEPLTPDQIMTKAVAELSGWNYRIQCTCGNESGFALVRLMAGTYGWNAMFRDIMRRLACSRCGRKPNRALMVDRPDRAAKGKGGASLGPGHMVEIDLTRF